MKRVRVGQMSRHLKEEPIPPLNCGHKSNRLESIGESLKTMTARYSNIKLGKMFEDDTTNINDVEKALSLVNIKIRDTETSFRPMGDVLDELGSKWSSLTELEQGAASVAMAGKNMMPERMVTYGVFA
jgi:hypothetical protein